MLYVPDARGILFYYSHIVRFKALLFCPNDFFVVFYSGALFNAKLFEASLAEKVFELLEKDDGSSDDMSSDEESDL